MFGYSAVVQTVNSFSGIHKLLLGSQMLNAPPGAAKVFFFDMFKVERKSTELCQSLPRLREAISAFGSSVPGLHFFSVCRMRLWWLPGEENLLRRLMFLPCNNLLCQKKMLPHSLPFCLYNCHKQCTLCTSTTPLFTWSTGQPGFERRHRARQ